MAVHNAPDPITQAYNHINKHKLITMTGLPPGIRESLSTQDAEMLCVYSETLSDVSSWVLADLLLWAEDRVAADLGTRIGVEFYTRRDEAWTQLMRLTKREYTQATLRNMRAVARAFPYERRRISSIISFKHHRLLVSFPDDAQDYYLDLCEDYEWNSVQLERHLYNQRNDIDHVSQEAAGDIVLATFFERNNLRPEKLGRNVATFIADADVLEIKAVLVNGQAQLEYSTILR